MTLYMKYILVCLLNPQHLPVVCSPTSKSVCF